MVKGARESDFTLTENKRKKIVVGRERAKKPGRDKMRQSVRER